MTIHLTPDMAEAAYTLLRTAPPFRRLTLPHPDDVQFFIYHKKHAWHAECKPMAAGKYRINLNTFKTGTLTKLLMDMAHEMAHLHLFIAHPEDDAAHGWRFKRLADSICKHHVWDRCQF